MSNMWSWLPRTAQGENKYLAIISFCLSGHWANGFIWLRRHLNTLHFKHTLYCIARAQIQQNKQVTFLTANSKVSTRWYNESEIEWANSNGQFSCDEVIQPIWQGEENRDREKKAIYIYIHIFHSTSKWDDRSGPRGSFKAKWMNKHIVVILVSEEKQNIDSLSNSQENVPTNQDIKKSWREKSWSGDLYLTWWGNRSLNWLGAKNMFLRYPKQDWTQRRSTGEGKVLWKKDLWKVNRT